MEYLPYAGNEETSSMLLKIIPTDWRLIKLKFLLRKKITDGPHETPEFTSDGVPFLSVDGIQDGELVFEGCRTISYEDHVRYSKKCLIEEGDVLLGKAASTGKIARVKTEREFSVWSPLAVMKNDRSVLLPAYFEYSLKSELSQYQIDMLCTSNTQKNISMDDIPKLLLAIPPLEQQQKIAAFLDYKTQQIDQLIEKKKSLIEKLEEKRIAVITQAVTKGLDKSAKLKPSGVDWLGDVPDGWKVRKLRFIGVCQNGINIGAEYFGRGDPFVSYGDVYNNKELPSSVKGLVQSSDSDKKAYSVETGDILFTRTSETIEEIGFSSVCMETIEDAVFAGFLIRVRPEANEISMKFSKYYFQNILLRVFFVKEMNLVTRASLSQDLLKKLPVLLPSIDEQIIIANYLDEATSKTEKMVEKVQSAIDKLIEYKAAIVTSAVTGKIDVREVEVSKEVA